MYVSKQRGKGSPGDKARVMSDNILHRLTADGGNGLARTRGVRRDLYGLIGLVAPGTGASNVRSKERVWSESLSSCSLDHGQQDGTELTTWLSVFFFISEDYIN